MIFDVDNLSDEMIKSFKVEMGSRIQEARISKGITGAEMGAYLNITYNQVSRIERGEAALDIIKLCIICKLLDVSADYILFGTTAPIKLNNAQQEAITSLLKAFAV